MLSLGDDLYVVLGRQHIPNCRFIKVTRKGFNILNLDTNRVILKRHVYMKGMGNKEYRGSGPITGEFLISDYVGLKIKTRIEGNLSVS